MKISHLLGVVCASVLSITQSYASTVEFGLMTVQDYAANPVLNFSGSGFDATRVEDPTIVKVGSTYSMYYGGLPFSNPYEIGLATSTDGLSWVKSGSNPVLPRNLQSWSAFRVQPRTVMYEGGTYKMWYYGDDINLDANGQAGYATSVDGVNWSVSASNPIISRSNTSNTGIDLREVVKLDGEYIAYYRDKEVSGKMYSTSSSDGINFIDNGELSNPDGIDLVAASSITLNAEEYVFSIGQSDLGQHYGLSRNGADFVYNTSLIAFADAAEDFNISSIMFEDNIVKLWGDKGVGNINWSFGNVNIRYGTTQEPDWNAMISALDSSAVPVPAAAWLFGSGLIGLIGIARKRKHA